MKEKLQHLLFLKDEIAFLKTQTVGSGKGSFFTAINILEWRVETLVKEIGKNI